MSALRGRFCRPVVVGQPEPERRLLAAVVIQAVKDARGGDFAAAAWLDDLDLRGWLADVLGGVNVGAWRTADLGARLTSAAERARKRAARKP